MANDDKLASDDTRRSQQHGAIKSEVSQEVQQEVVREAKVPAAEDSSRAEALAESLRLKAVREVEATESQITHGATAARVSQVIDYVFFLIYGVIALAIVLEGLGAREGAGFASFINAVTAPLLAPFRGLLWDPSVGGSQFMISYVVALVVYALLHAAINGALRIVAHRKTEV
jgi:uncharacterized protein YggT (Ycf19 family)